MVDSATLKSDLVSRLRKLTNNAAIWREDLKEFLKVELNDVCAYWRLDLDTEPEVLRKLVRARLIQHFKWIPPNTKKTRQSNKGRFWTSYNATFNLGLKSEGLEITKRQKALRYPFDTVRDDVTFALEQIASQLMQDPRFVHRGVAEVPDLVMSGLEDASPSSSQSSEVAHEPKTSIEDDDKAQPAPRSRSKKPLIITLGVVAVLVATAVIVRKFTSGTDDPPTYLTVQQSPLDIRTNQSTSPDLVIPQPLSQISRPPGAEGAAFDAWKAQYHAVYADTMHVTFIARGTVAEPTIVMGARVEFDRRETPLTGTHVTPDGGAQQPVRQLFTGLDQNPAKLTTDGSWQFPLRTSNTDPEVFTVTARTAVCHCFWHVVLSVVLPNNQAKDIVVNDNGKPFEMTGSSAATDRTYLPHDAADPWPRLTQ